MPPIRHVERPWGSFKQFAHNQSCTVSLMTVLPGQRLSLQSHTNRAELWVVIDDGAVVQVGEDQHVWFVFLACSNAEGQSAVYIHGRGSKAGGKALPTNELS